MFVHFNEAKMKLPVKIWLDSLADVDPICLQQTINLSNLSILEGWVALMPDTHQGFGMPIGGVIAAKDHIIPNAVGVDIGCGMAYVETDLRKEQLKPFHVKKIIDEIMRTIPLGFKHHDQKQSNHRLTMLIENSEEWLIKNQLLYKEIDRVFYQLATLGSGNHFIEFQEDESGKICIMLHTGSRNFGLKIANYYNDKAEYHCKKKGDKHAVKSKLSYLPVNTESGENYARWMNLALEFAKENRAMLLERVMDVLMEAFPAVTFGNIINAHHNYASLEEHLGQALWIHRKGAIRVEKDDLGIIPGAMGSYSYIVKGLGNIESFNSCSHGAGRHMSRKEAMKRFNKDDILKTLNSEGVYIGVPPKSIVSDESREAYKDILVVMEQQKDLVVPIKRLKTVIVVKG
ncbi:MULTISPECIES: RtcB family protein [unclassified Fusibacter]|uniref:RtcB family protein n=1 Tax=unclassified Fusibacter TaxID=2624464 RepID=UPI0010108CD4|nr:MULTISPECIES: RtcB family protein [unclassified Fusibacter]MCK8061708.1 RtcB family protein [Fusibacter sp. A2]NPE23882.1 RtcB family protein [Fusibacter sp. A1]RXV58506.1 RtcB family protein [Fusibacter sp. A1]